MIKPILFLLLFLSSGLTYSSGMHSDYNAALSACNSALRSYPSGGGINCAHIPSGTPLPYLVFWTSLFSQFNISTGQYVSVEVRGIGGQYSPCNADPEHYSQCEQHKYSYGACPIGSSVGAGYQCLCPNGAPMDFDGSCPTCESPVGDWSPDMTGSLQVGSTFCYDNCVHTVNLSSVGGSIYGGPSTGQYCSSADGTVITEAPPTTLPPNNFDPKPGDTNNPTSSDSTGDSQTPSGGGSTGGDQEEGDETSDYDEDGIPDAQDNDIDGDGITNEHDTDQSQQTDQDGDGIADAQDNDIDGDGIINENDPDHTGLSDQDSDGIPDGDDNDIDGDGIINEYDPDHTGASATSTDCEQEPESRGDPQLSAIHRQLWINTCKGEELDPGEFSAQMESEFPGVTEEVAPAFSLAAGTIIEIDGPVSSLISGVFSSNSYGACPIVDASVMGVNFPFSMLCIFFPLMSAVLYAFAVIRSGNIMFDALVN